MLGHLEVLLAGMSANLEQPIAHLRLLTEAERHQLVVEWNDTKRDYPPDLCLHHLFEAQVERTPDAIALTYEGQHLSYRELNERANQLAHYLRSLGVGSDVLVGLYMDRCLEMVIGIYAVIKAGGAYVPLDPEYPPERVVFMMQDAQAPVLLTQQKWLAGLPESKATLICVDTDGAAIAGYSTENLASAVGPDHLAYVIFTSGSTGRPKGVMNSHKGICNRLLWMQEAYQLSPVDRVMQKTPFSFDVSVWEFFWPLLVGARLVLARPGGHKDRDYLVRLIVEQEISTLHFVPSMLQIFLEANNVTQCRSLKRVICSGEALPYELQQRFFARMEAELHNLYGPTEAAVDVTYWACQHDDPRAVVPIGRPVANTQIYILDPYLQPVPVGVPGELHIGGVQVAHGYLNRPELTAEKFIHDPFSADPAARLYKTGDLARYLPDGAIEYLGRIDHQVKIRGFRIELGEIETVLGQHPRVQEAVVVVRETDQKADKQLVAYIVPAPDQEPTLPELRAFLAKKVPDYMIPAAFVILGSMPLTPNGKVNRRALPAPDPARPMVDQPYVGPRNDTEARLAQIWSEVLKVERVGIHDNFFEMGGHSLLATLMISRIQQRFQVDLPVQALFDAPTVAGLAVLLVQKEAGQLDDEMLLQMLAALEALPDDEV
jgi:amino acid adenylation domain-containing protein